MDTDQSREFGCLGKSIAVVLFVVTAGLLAFYSNALTKPWSFFMGGGFHGQPRWEGMARIQTKTAGDHALFLRLYPSKGPRSNGAGVTGVATLCTSHQAAIDMRLGGGMGQIRFTDTNTDGKPMHLQMNSHPVRKQFTNDARPRLEFRGQWKGPDLVLSDGGSVSRAFQPDGAPYLGPEGHNRAAKETVAVTFRASTEAEFRSTCAAIQAGRAH